jgi:nitrite reductase (NO-forming)
MMNKTISPNVVAAILIATTLIALVLLPISIEIKADTALAQETPSMSDPQLVSYAVSTVEYTLRTAMGLTPPMAFVGVGGDIDEEINPDLTVNVGDTVTITVINGDPVAHDLTLDEFDVKTEQLTDKDQQVTISFTATTPGDFVYYCSLPGHRDIGMYGTLHVTGEASAESSATAVPPAVADAAVPAAQPAAADAVSVVHNPADLPPPIGDRGPENVRVDLVTEEVSGQLADGTTYSYFTFNGTVPGPMIRVRVGDTVEVHLQNSTGSLFPHSIDLHAVTGPGGGAVYTQTNPGEETMFRFQALNPGVYVYHCATPSVAHHIASGMYGLIVVEPAGGLPPVDKEFYVMQGEIYTLQPFSTPGNLDYSHERMLNEDPEYYVFNGESMALTQDDYALRASVGDTVRIFFGVGGPNKTSSFHVIGEILDRVYNQASLTGEPETDVQTTSVPPGGATMVEFQVQVPGRYILVDHALARLERGLAGYLYVEGDENPDVFFGEALTPGSGH